MSCSLKPCVAVRDVMLILAAHDLAPDNMVWQLRTFLDVMQVGVTAQSKQTDMNMPLEDTVHRQSMSLHGMQHTCRKGLNQHNSCSTAHCPATCVTRQVNHCWRQHRMASSPSASMMHSQFVFGAQIVASTHGSHSQCRSPRVWLMALA